MASNTPKSPPSSDKQLSLPKVVHASSVKKSGSKGAPTKSTPAPQVSSLGTFQAALETARPKSIQDMKLNLISEVLNAPAIKQYKISKTELPYVPVSNIRKVKITDFDPYIQAIENLYANYQGRINDEKTSSEASSLHELNNEPSEGDGQATSVLVRERLKHIPSIFFEASFNLEDPRVFEKVCEGLDMSSSLSGEISSSSLILHEKISNYLDAVEVDLVGEISKRSTTFFVALSNLQTLNSETLKCIEQIKKLRKAIKAILDTQCRQGLELISLRRRRENLANLMQTIQMIADIKTAQPTIQVLLGQGDFVGALDIVKDSISLLRGYGTRSKKLGMGGSILTSALYGVQMEKDSSIIGNQRSTKLSLKGVRALRHLELQFEETNKSIGKVLVADFVSALMQEVRYSYQNPKDSPYPQASWLKRLLENKEAYFIQLGTPSSEILPSSNTTEADELQDALKEKIAPLIQALVRIDSAPLGMSSFREELLHIIPVVMKKSFPDFSEDDSDKFPPKPIGKGMDKNDTNVSRIRGMNFNQFLAILVTLFADLACITRRVALIHEIMAMALMEADAQGMIVQEGDSNVEGETDSQKEKKVADGTKNPQQPILKLISLSSDALHGFADNAHVQCAKFLGYRTDQNIQLPTTEFYRLFGVCWGYILENEAVCGKMCFGLRGTLLSQAKNYLTQFHNERMRQLNLILESEQWNQAEVPVDFQDIVQNIIEYGDIKTQTSIHLEKTLTPDSVQGSTSSLDDLKKSEGQMDEEDSDIFGSISNVTSKSSSGRQLFIKNQRFYVVGTSLMFLRFLSEYLQFMIHAPVLATDLLHKLAEFLKVFNSKICQLILGAGAVMLAGLKSITAKHLALSAQTLKVVIELIPYLKESIRRNIPSKQGVILSSLDRVLKDFEDHVGEIHSKLVTIMTERVIYHCKQISAVAWDTPITEESQPSPYIVSLVKETFTLHKVLSKYMVPLDLKTVMARVFINYNAKIESSLRDIDIYSSHGKARMLIDVQFFIRKMSSIEGLEGPGSHLEVVVNSINIKDRRGARTTFDKKKTEMKASTTTPSLSTILDKPKTAISKTEAVVDPSSQPGENVTALKTAVMSKMIFNKTK